MNLSRYFIKDFCDLFRAAFYVSVSPRDLNIGGRGEEGRGWLEGLSQKPQNICPKIAKLKKY